MEIDMERMELSTPMVNKLVIFMKDDEIYRLFEKVFDDISLFHEKGFTLMEILNFNTLSWEDKRLLKEILSGNYSEILMPEMKVYNNNGKWLIEKTEVSHHGYIMKILNRIRVKGNATIRSRISTSDYKLIGCLIDNWNDIFMKEIGVEDIGYEINMEMLEFISFKLREKFGSLAHINYDFVKAFLESLSQYDQMMVKRELGES